MPKISKLVKGDAHNLLLICVCFSSVVRYYYYQQKINNIWMMKLFLVFSTVSFAIRMEFSSSFSFDEFSDADNWIGTKMIDQAISPAPSPEQSQDIPMAEPATHPMQVDEKPHEFMMGSSSDMNTVWSEGTFDKND